MSTAKQHDPLCLKPLCDYGKPDGYCNWYADCGHECMCRFIAQVRADERATCIAASSTPCRRYSHER